MIIRLAFIDSLEQRKEKIVSRQDLLNMIHTYQNFMKN